MHRASPIIIEQISNHGNDCLDSAIKRYWSGYVPELGWHPSSSVEYWLENSSTTVHYNTLTGRLLVRGSPLLYLPADIVAHKSYVRLFGRSLINVVPSNIKGMEFSSKRLFQDHNLHFSRQATSKHSSLLIRATKHSSVYDFIPSGIMAGLIPDSFINDFVHWYHHDKGEVEFRPVTDPWKSSQKNWRLVSEGSKWKLIHDNNDQVVNPSSATAKSICKVFGALDNALNQNVIYSPIQNNLSISLPRLRISFLIRNMSDSIESHQFRGMQVDEQQFIGTLVGLESKLTLRSSDGSENRLVLVPNGQVIFGKKDIYTAGPHTRVSVRTEWASGVQSYSIDASLGRLIDKGTLKSKLFLAYLHALTSYCVPDTLTNITGVEQALSIIKSSAIKSSTCLTKEEGFLLEQIAKLAPGRSFYPTNERVMQEVAWSSHLSFISQHGLFYKISKEIVQNISRIGFLYPHQDVPKLGIEHADDELVERDLIKTSQLRVDGFGAELFSTKFDKNYKSRDCTQGSERAMRIIEMAKRARNVRLSLQESPQKDLIARIYQLLSNASHFSAKEEEPTLHEMQYNASWLIDPEGTIGNLWYKIHHSFQNKSAWLDPYAVIMWLAAQTFKSENVNQVNQVLFALAFLPRVTEVRLPDTDTYHLSQGYCFKHNEIRSLVASQVRTLEECPEVGLTKYSYESNRNFFGRRSREYHNNKNDAISTFVEKLQEQWPNQHPQEPPASSYIDGRAAMSAISGKWRTWHKNLLFAEYLSRIFDALRTYDVQSQNPSFLSIRSQIMPATSHKAFFSVDDMFQMNSPSNLFMPNIELEICCQVLQEESSSHMRLGTILEYLKGEAASLYEQHYLIELENSLSALKRYNPRCHVSQSKKEVEDALRQYKSTCTHSHDLMFKSLMLDTDMIIPVSQRSTQRLSNARIQAIEGQSNFLPRRSPSIFLCQLQRFRWKTLSKPWKIKIVAYGIALSLLQRANRLLQQRSNEVDFMKELQNKGHEEWNPLEYPEWLLMECENDFLIRHVQQQTAMTMMAPPNGDNTVMQLNMGEGKSSVLVPSIALALADSSRLVRVIVTKPQFRQMYQSLIARYGNMVSRRIYQFPISREIRLDRDKIQAIQQMLRECMEEGGIMLVQPEHLLSFQLMGIECWFNSDDIVARELSMLQEYFDVHSRDIIDESDENLSVEYELVYTIGQQRATEQSPQRWLVVLQVLELIQRLAPDIQSEYPQFCEVYDWGSTSQRFPRLGIFHEDALKEFLDRLAKQICHQGLEGFPIARQPETMRIAVQRAKDEPALRSEFSHPDIVIILTSLSYYYAGLTDEDMFELFALLKNDDQATSEYVLWVHYASSLPDAYTELDGINLRDRIQCTTKVFPCLRYSKGAIDYFLSRVVFAKEMREFPHKLSASGWDLGKTKSYPTTGFSGTNDSRYVLPTSVKQFDLPDQRHTSALVLSYIVKPENNVFMLPKCTVSEGETSSGTDILRSLVQLKPQVRVILDVGAQIIDLTNQEAAQQWLRMVQSDDDRTQAAIYFDENDILSVVDRFDCIEPLQVSPFAKQMDKCLVFLDESHTRGTDLRLPQDYRAAVTLGNNLTKDRLVQACMRMRKLAYGQSVVFCVPEMIANKILQRHHISELRDITINHVIIWAIYQTHFDAKKSAPLWATQALRFYKQDNYRQQRIQHQSDYSCEWAERFLEEEAQSLENRYRPGFSNLEISSLLQDIDESLSEQITNHLSQFGLVNIGTASLQEEQERELSPEAEEERQVEKPPYAKALAHHIHPNLRYFVQHGKIDMHRGGFLHAFSSLASTSAAINANVEELPRDLLVTEDFAQTIKIDWQRNYQSDLFQRPVQWILTVGLEDESKVHLVIISPYEAQGLLEDIKSSATVTLHIYAPRMNETHPSLDNLMLYTIPERKKAKMIPQNLVIQLNLFAGQLYLSSFKEYTQICDTLCLSWNVCESDIALGPDGFIPLGFKVGNCLNDGQYTCSPTNFFQIFLTKTRLNNESIDKTHMGKILNGLLLRKEDISS
ncbi:hypothetical protein EAE99_007768 [Botrytis elliptica]|nr:hypothetical protein EAE99_007768 [Botrytis elliptica]